MVGMREHLERVLCGHERLELAERMPCLAEEAVDVFWRECVWPGAGAAWLGVCVCELVLLCVGGQMLPSKVASCPWWWWWAF
jgi:hypothetical protein